MEIVSEVDRKFFANNMLSNEDWDATMELSDIMGLEDNLPHIDLLPEVQESSHFQEPPEDDFMSYFPSVSHDDLIHDWSDSSDSGISGTAGVQSPGATVKCEPLSPVSPYLSDSCDSAVSMVFNSQELLQQPSNHQHHHHQQQQTFPQTDVIKIEPSSFSCPSSPLDLSMINNPITYTTSVPATGGPSFNINSILNSKIKIQPKPEQGTVQEVKSPKKLTRTTVTGQVRGQKSLVLTAEEFQRLANSGVLRLQPPPQKETVVKGPAPVITNIPQTLPLLSMNTSGFEDKEAKVVKRQQRMIKNRESASLSRKRKKEYMSTLEVKLHEYSSENEKLRHENLALKRKLSTLNYENESLKKTFSVSSVAPVVKKTCLLAVFVMLSLNLGSWSGVQLAANSDSSVLSNSVIHKGRQLLTVPDQDVDQTWSLPEDTVDKLHNLILEYGEGRGGRSGVYNITDVPPMCPTYFNKTESMRLAEQLAGWMYRHEEEKKKVDTKQRKAVKDKELRPLSMLRRAMRDDLNLVNRKYVRSMDANQLQLYGGADTGRDFLKSIHRRNDTFYVLSFDEDYYLVPAVYHNKTSRPRMSLVMPALALNESMMPPDGQVGMMQVDCEVMNTQLIHVQKAAIPRHVRTKHNNSYTRYESHHSYTP